MIPIEVVEFERVMGRLVEDVKLPLLSKRTCLKCKETMGLGESWHHECR
jgi:hypothetical protein